MKSTPRIVSPGKAPVKDRVAGTEVLIRPVGNELEAQEAVRLLADQIPVGFSEKIPSMPVKDDGMLRPTLIGAFRDEALIGAAFIGPAEHIAAQAASLLFMREPATVIDETVQSLRRNVAYMAGIAVSPGYRRQGVGRRIKLFCERWAADHSADVIIGVSTTDEAVALNKGMGYTVLPQGVALVLQCVDVKTREYVNAIPIALGRSRDNGMSRWAFKQLTETRRSPVLMGQLVMVGQARPAFAKKAAGEDEPIHYIEWSILGADGKVTAFSERVQ